MRLGNNFGDAIGIRVKDNHIVGAIFATNLFRYPFLYISKQKGEFVIEALDSQLNKLRVKDTDILIFRKPQEIVVEKSSSEVKKYEEVNLLPKVVGNLTRARVYKVRGLEDYLIFSPFTDLEKFIGKDFSIRSIEPLLV